MTRFYQLSESEIADYIDSVSNFIREEAKRRGIEYICDRHARYNLVNAIIETMENEWNMARDIAEIREHGLPKENEVLKLNKIKSDVNR